MPVVKYVIYYKDTLIHYWEVLMIIPMEWKLESLGKVTNELEILMKSFSCLT